MWQGRKILSPAQKKMQRKNFEEGMLHSSAYDVVFNKRGYYAQSVRCDLLLCSAVAGRRA